MDPKKQGLEGQGSSPTIVENPFATAPLRFAIRNTPSFQFCLCVLFSSHRVALPCLLDLHSDYVSQSLLPLMRKSKTIVEVAGGKTHT